MATDFLITGGAGFIGSNVAERLVREGRSVRVLDNFLTGKRDNLRSFQSNAEIIEGDLRSFDDVRRAVAGVRFVMHIGALPSVPRSVEDPRTAHDINVTGTLNVLVAARDAGCQRVVFSSSSSVYGDLPTLPKREDMPAAPLSPYAAQKVTGEYYGAVFWRLYGVETLSLRYFNVFGPRQDPQSQYAAVVPKFIVRILAGEPPTVYGDGEQSRDFTYIDNVVDANVAACHANKSALGESFNIACGERFTLLELIDAIGSVTGKVVKPRFEPARPGDVRHSQADIGKAGKLLGWEPRISFRDGLEKTIAWYRG
jgi:nucleoside-diphosphate-sugar epimerase